MVIGIGVGIGIERPLGFDDAREKISLIDADSDSDPDTDENIGRKPRCGFPNLSPVVLGVGIAIGGGIVWVPAVPG